MEVEMEDKKFLSLYEGTRLKRAGTIKRASDSEIAGGDLR